MKIVVINEKGWGVGTVEICKQKVVLDFHELRIPLTLEELDEIRRIGINLRNWAESQAKIVKNLEVKR